MCGAEHRQLSAAVPLGYFPAVARYGANLEESRLFQVPIAALDRGLCEILLAAYSVEKTRFRLPVRTTEPC
jgi:hypothetical protein